TAMTSNDSPLRYLPWFVRDAVVWPLRMFVLGAVLVSVLVWRFKANMHLPGGHPGPGNPFGSGITSIAQMMQVSVWALCLTVAILMTVGGIVGTDLERGYYRSWFSKPMAPYWYYLQRWLVGAVVILVTPVVLGLGLAASLGQTGLSWSFMAQIALAYLVIASATMLVSIFTSRGWLVVFLLAILQGVLSQVARSGLIPMWLVRIHQALPPFHLVGMRAPLPHGGDLWHVVLYGVAMLVAALALLRFRPLGSGITT
ncbi:MAG: hypothetical protein ACREL5_14975, partial [Gemmatimonadales bacterium]